MMKILDDGDEVLIRVVFAERAQLLDGDNLIIHLEYDGAEDTMKFIGVQHGKKIWHRIRRKLGWQ